MSKSRRNREHELEWNGAPPVERSSSFLSLGTMLGAALAGIAVLVLLAFMTWDQMRQLQSRLDDRLPQIENRLAQLSTKVDQVASRAPAAANQGLDPSRIYTVKMEGAPVRGPKSAPVTIAEFSDFQ
jgi:protein-disulfide isomerase